ncbi:AMP-binding protein [Sphingomonas naphthae]|uniref:AMP-binding protein n=1 Tax=Sphingomonas naphthae TaxID=1813468 RepID=A0ABY7TKA2_9SPHN|nr:AMP-binding protein [Sphingomonas naphthae]WCT73468.1 AMP-binding protein [Sphingomonas naphthae]
MVERRTLHGWSIRWDAARAADARARGLWIDETIAEIAARKAADEPTAELIVDGDRRLDAATLHAEAGAVAQAMIARGFVPGDTISFMLPNWHEAAVIYLAATLAGLVAQPIVPALRDHEVSFQLQDSRSRMLFIPADFRKFDYREMMRRVRPGLAAPVEVVVLRGDAGEFTAYDTLLAHRGDAPLPTVDPDSVKMVMYTSGTTGRPKGVLHTHNSLHALVTQLHQHWRAGTGDAFFVPSPISHIGGSIYAFEFPLLFGTRAVLQDMWEPDAAVDIMLRERCTHMAGATPFLEATLAAARARGTDMPDLSVFICGGASVPPVLIREANGYFAKAVVSRVFGSTEVPVTTVGSMTPGDIEHAAETDGRIGIAEVRLVDGEGMVGDEGEVRAMGPQMLAGYLAVEQEEDAFDAEGYFRMGDLARRVDGDYLVITGRAKDIIIRNGENIAPKEIEDLLVQHPDIADVTIVGLPDAKTGERCCAVIVPRNGARPDVAALKIFLDGHKLARFKIPEQVALADALPRNAAGKVMKHIVRAGLLPPAPEQKA